MGAADPGRRAGARRGFTLVEVVIVVAMVAILATIALPSYQQYMVRTRRSEVQQFMLQAASREEQYLLDMRDYTTVLADLGLTLPSTVSPYYTVTIARLAGPPLGYTITATPVSGSSQASDGTLTLASSGSKTPAEKWK